MGNTWSKQAPPPYNRATSSQQFTVEVIQVPIHRTERIDRASDRIVSTARPGPTMASNSNTGRRDNHDRAVSSSSATTTDSSRIIRQIHQPAVAPSPSFPISAWSYVAGVFTACGGRRSKKPAPFQSSLQVPAISVAPFPLSRQISTRSTSDSNRSEPRDGTIIRSNNQNTARAAQIRHASKATQQQEDERGFPPQNTQRGSWNSNVTTHHSASQDSFGSGLTLIQSGGTWSSDVTTIVNAGPSGYTGGVNHIPQWDDGYLGNSDSGDGDNGDHEAEVQVEVGIEITTETNQESTNGGRNQQAGTNPRGRAPSRDDVATGGFTAERLYGGVGSFLGYGFMLEDCD